jgi:hypothetical protein
MDKQVFEQIRRLKRELMPRDKLYRARHGVLCMDGIW